VNTYLAIANPPTCLVCGGRKLHYGFSVGSFRVEECANCGLRRVNPQPTDVELARIHGSTDFAFSDDPKRQLRVAGVKASAADYYLHLLETYVGSPLSGRLVEVGCGPGDFLARAAVRGISVTGVESSPNLARIAAEKLGPQGRVICGGVKQLRELRETFDFVVLSDLIELVRDPRELLQDVQPLMREDGVVVLVVATLDSASARLMKRKWIESKPERLWYFSSDTLKRLLYTEGFGALRTYPAPKTLSLDYVAEPFSHSPAEPFPGLGWPLRGLARSLHRRHAFRVTAGNLVVMGRKEERRERKLLSVIMPVFNEEKSVRAGIERVLAKRIPGVDIELIIVESTSTDGTREIVREYEGRERILIVWEEQPRGKGHAVRAGLECVCGDFVLIQDADDEYDIEDYDALIEPLMSGETAFVLGARHGGYAWKMRRFNDQRLAGNVLNFGHWLFATLVNVVYGLRLKDPFTMYKVFRADCLRGLRFECNRFDFDYELLIKLVRRGYRPIEVPVNYRSRSFKEGKKVNVLRDPWTWLWAILKYRFQRI
jgi:SAM-dependent methyltransferase